MVKDTVGGQGSRQNPSNCKADSGAARRFTGPSAGPVLLTDEQLADEVLNVSVRTAAELMKQPWAPRPVLLGPRLKRHVRSEWEAAVANMPRQEAAADEPAHLRRGKIEALKSRGVPV